MNDDNVRSLSQIRARPIDPRDGRWEVEPSAYRVYFWAPAGERAMVGNGSPMWAAFERELSGGRNVVEVLRWARRHAEGRCYTIYAVVDDVPAGGGIVQVLGVDPTRAS